VIVSLFDETAIVVQPWLEAGYKALIADIKHPRDSEEGSLVTICGNLKNREAWLARALDDYPIHLLCCFPPCTDLAISGVAHFGKKYLRDPFYVEKAMELIYLSLRLGNRWGCPFFIENPVSVMSTVWRKPDYTFDPYEFGGYLPENDWHPKWPEFIPPRDAYPKRTCLWTGGGFTLPPKLPVPIFVASHVPQMDELGGKSERTKMIRSATPRGFAAALYHHYKDGDNDTSE